MATIPPFRGVRERASTIAETVMGWMAEKKQPQGIVYDKLEKTAALWLRGNSLAMDTLQKLIEARHEARALLPVPGTPHELAVYEGRNREGRDIVALLTKIYHAPVEFGSEDEPND